MLNVLDANTSYSSVKSLYLVMSDLSLCYRVPASIASHSLKVSIDESRSAAGGEKSESFSMEFTKWES